MRWGRLRLGMLVVVTVAGSVGCASSGDAPRRDGGPGAEAGASDAEVADGAASDGALQPDAGPCAISQGQTLLFNGVGDQAKHLRSQIFAPGVPMNTSDAAALSWDPTYLYVTVTSQAFTGAFEPLHIYVEARTTLPAAVASTGKEYGGLTPALPFTPTHLIALRRQTDSGTGGPYDGVYTPAASWSTRSLALEPGTDVFPSNEVVAPEFTTLSVRTPWSALALDGCPTRLRIAAHVVHGVVANEWKDTIPTTHTPWQAPNGGYYEIDLTGPTSVAGWTLR